MRALSACYDPLMDWGKLAVRVGVAFAFLYPPIDAIFHPYAWVDFFPRFVAALMPTQELLIGWGIVQVVIGLWILSGKKIFWPSVAATIMLATIVALNLAVFDIVFRDLAIACGAFALAWWSYQE